MDHSINVRIKTVGEGEEARKESVRSSMLNGGARASKDTTRNLMEVVQADVLLFS